MKTTDLRLLGETETGRALSLVEDGKDALEEDVAEDGEADAGVGLDAAEAGGRAGGDGSVVDVRAGNDEDGTADGDGEVGGGAAAGESVATLGAVVAGTGEGLVVGSDGGGGQVHEGGAGVSDGGADAARGAVAGADAVAARGELPETLRVIHGGVGDAAGVLGGVNVAEVVGAGSALLEGGGEQRRGEAALHGVEEGGLLGGGDGVDGAEGQAEETIGGGVLSELAGDGGGSLNRLRGGGNATDDHGVGVDIATGTRAVTVADAPAGAGDLLGRGGLAWVVCGLAINLVGGSLGGEDPAE